MSSGVAPLLFTLISLFGYSERRHYQVQWVPFPNLDGFIRVELRALCAVVYEFIDSACKNVLVFLMVHVALVSGSEFIAQKCCAIVI